MGLFSRTDHPHPTWEPAVRKAPWWSANAGTYSGFVNGEKVASGKTRREAQRIADREARRRNRS